VQRIPLSVGVLEKCSAEDPRRPRLLGMRALVLDLSKEPQADVEAAFREAVDAGYADPSLLELGRRLWPVTADEKHRYRLIVQARSNAVAGADGFFRIFDVVAQSPERALEHCRVYLPAEARASAALHRADVADAEELELEPGCHSASELMYFSDEPEA